MLLPIDGENWRNAKKKNHDNTGVISFYVGNHPESLQETVLKFVGNRLEKGKLSGRCPGTTSRFVVSPDCCRKWPVWGIVPRFVGNHTKICRE